MNLCDIGHDEVCYAVSDCPLCALKEEMKDLRDELEATNKENKNLNGDIEILENQIKALSTLPEKAAQRDEEKEEDR